MDSFLLERRPQRAERHPNSAGGGEMERGEQVEETGAETTGSRREEKG